MIAPPRSGRVNVDGVGAFERLMPDTGHRKTTCAWYDDDTCQTKRSVCSARGRYSSTWGQERQ